MTFSAVRLKRAAILPALALAASMFCSSPRSNANAPPNGAGESIFKARCVRCHGEDGSGRTTLGQDMKAPDLRSDEVQSLSDAELAAAVATGKGDMPAFRKKLSREQIQQVILHIRQLAKGR